MSSKINKYLSKVYIISISLLTLSVACNNADYSAQEKQIDSLELVLDSAERIKNYDPEYYKMLVDSVKKDMAFVAANYPDSLTIDEALTMDYYKSIKKAGTNFAEAYDILVAENVSLRKQLNDLEGTLKSGDMSKDSFAYYYEVEKKDVYRQLEQTNKVLVPIELVETWKDSIMDFAQTVIAKAKLVQQEKENK